MNIKESFLKFENANFFSRVDAIHILDLFIGLDGKGRKCIELRAKFEPRKFLGTVAIEVAQYKRPDYNTIRFSLIDNEVSGLFYKFCEDIIEQTRDVTDKSEGYKAVTNRFLQWKKMFVVSKNSLLNENQIMGLIGELLCLKGFLADDMGIYPALLGWSGQSLTHKDFSYDNKWYESKAISSGSRFIKISSINQLDSNVDGELVVHVLEKMSPAYKGISLNNLIIETKKMFASNVEQDRFMTCVALQGYEYNDYYNEFVYEINGFYRYLVNDKFPKLTKKDLPVAIAKAIYEIALTEISDFEIKNVGE